MSEGSSIQHEHNNENSEIFTLHPNSTLDTSRLEVSSERDVPLSSVFCKSS